MSERSQHMAELRQMINDVLLEDGLKMPPLRTFDQVEVLILVAVNMLDYCGGIADREHAIRRCHELVDKCGGLQPAAEE